MVVDDLEAILRGHPAAADADRAAGARVPVLGARIPRRAGVETVAGVDTCFAAYVEMQSVLSEADDRPISVILSPRSGRRI